MSRTFKLLAVGAVAVLIATFGIAAPADAVSISTGCSFTAYAPTKSGNVITAKGTITCNNPNITGDSLFYKLWRNNGNGTYTSFPVTEDSAGANFTTYNIFNSHTCTGTTSRVWHAEAYGDIQYTTGDVPFTGLNSPDVTLACL